MYKILKTVIKLISNFLPNSLKNHKQSGKLQTNTTRVEVDAIDRNRPTDLLNQKRNSFGLKYPNNSRVLGTKGDVETFFLVLNDLVSSKVIEDRFQTISHDLYKTLINYRNIDDFIIETLELKDTFSMIEANSIDWTKYPYNRQIGKFDYQQMAIDVNKHKLLDVFHKFFNAFEDAAKADSRKYYKNIVTRCLQR